MDHTASISSTAGGPSETRIPTLGCCSLLRDDEDEDEDEDEDVVVILLDTRTRRNPRAMIRTLSAKDSYEIVTISSLLPMLEGRHIKAGSVGLEAAAAKNNSCTVLAGIVLVLVFSSTIDSLASSLLTPISETW